MLSGCAHLAPGSTITELAAGLARRADSFHARVTITIAQRASLSLLRARCALLVLKRRHAAKAADSARAFDRREAPAMARAARTAGKPMRATVAEGA